MQKEYMKEMVRQIIKNVDANVVSGNYGLAIEMMSEVFELIDALNDEYGGGEWWKKNQKE